MDENKQAQIDALIERIDQHLREHQRRRDHLQQLYGNELRQRPNTFYEVQDETLSLSRKVDEDINEYIRMKRELDSLQKDSARDEDTGAGH